MRMRFKPYAHDELMAADFHVHEPLIWGGKWHGQYARPEQPFVLELGCGKGGFISQLACAHPENNYLGIDITDKVLILAKRKIEAAYQAAGRPIDNVKIMSTDIERIKGVLTAEDDFSDFDEFESAPNSDEIETVAPVTESKVHPAHPSEKTQREPATTHEQKSGNGPVVRKLN